jgi:uncharacterized protein
VARALTRRSARATVRRMLVDRIKARMFQAMKAGDVVTKEILKVAMGELTTDQARVGRTGSDEEGFPILKKLVKSNEETLAATSDAAVRAQLERENEVLREFLPATLGLAEILSALEPVAAAIRAAGNDGQATGVAVKHLKASGHDVSGKDVSTAVKQLRS